MLRSFWLYLLLFIGIVSAGMLRVLPAQAATCRTACAGPESAWQQATGIAEIAGAEAGQNQAGSVQAVSSQPTTSANELRRVKVNFFINSLTILNDEEGAYELDFYLDFYWNDPLMTDKRLEEIDQALLWDPALELVNARSYQVLARSYANSLEPNTNTWLHYRIVGVFFTNFDLRKFPYDQQLLTLRIQSADYSANALLFDFAENDSIVPYNETAVVSPAPPSRHLSPDYVVNSWDLTEMRVQQQLMVLPYDKSSWSEFRVEMQVQRQSQSYVLRIVLELALLLLLFWGILVLDGQEVRYRLLLLFVLLLATVIFNFILLQILPQVAYLTWLDYLMLLCYGAILWLALVICLTRVLYKQERQEWAERLNRVAFVSYPGLLLAAGGLLYWYSLSA